MKTKFEVSANGTIEENKIDSTEKPWPVAEREVISKIVSADIDLKRWGLLIVLNQLRLANRTLFELENYLRVQKKCEIATHSKTSEQKYKSNGDKVTRHTIDICIEAASVDFSWRQI